MGMIVLFVGQAKASKASKPGLAYKYDGHPDSRPALARRQLDVTFPQEYPDQEDTTLACVTILLYHVPMGTHVFHPRSATVPSETWASGACRPPRRVRMA